MESSLYNKIVFHPLLHVCVQKWPVYFSLIHSFSFSDYRIKAPACLWVES